MIALASAATAARAMKVECHRVPEEIGALIFEAAGCGGDGSPDFTGVIPPAGLTLGSVPLFCISKGGGREAGDVVMVDSSRSLISRDYTPQRGQVTGGVTRMRSMCAERGPGSMGAWRRKLGDEF